jgi:cysteine desulfurase family protein
VTIYLDNAATANPKAPGVAAAMARSLEDCNANPGHGAHRLAMAAAIAVLEARAALAELLGVGDPRRVVFTAGATAALNQAILGSLPQGGHVICTTWEHNAVLRPLWAWRRQRGGRVTVLRPRPGRPLGVGDVLAALQPDTRLVVFTAASNVTGELTPVAEVGAELHRRGVRFLVDGAQAGGHLPLALDALPVDLWAFPGHKGLLGPQGIGLLVLAPGVEMEPVLLGGTGGRSEEEAAPAELPERFEAGTLNTPGILGLGAAAAFLAQEGIAALRARELARHAQLVEALRGIPGLELFTAPDPEQGVGVVSLRVAGWSSGAAAATLDRRFGICVRGGLHCAPLAHAALGTAPDGAVRLSVSPFTTPAEVDAAVAALRWLAAHGPEDAAEGV